MSVSSWENLVRPPRPPSYDFNIRCNWLGYCSTVHRVIGSKVKPFNPGNDRITPLTSQLYFRSTVSRLGRHRWSSERRWRKANLSRPTPYWGYRMSDPWRPGYEDQTNYNSASLTLYYIINNYKLNLKEWIYLFVLTEESLCFKYWMRRECWSCLTADLGRALWTFRGLLVEKI